MAVPHRVVNYGRDYFVTPKVLRFRFTRDGLFHIISGGTPIRDADPWPVEFSSDGKFAFVYDRAGSILTEYSVILDGSLMDEKQTRLWSGSAAMYIAPLRNGRYVYVASDQSGLVCNLRQTSAGLQFCNPQRLDLGQQVYGLVSSADSRYVYVVEDLRIATLKVTATSALMPTGAEIPVRYGQMALDAADGGFYVYGSNPGEGCFLRGYRSLPNGTLQLIPGLSAPAGREALNLVVVNQ